MKKMFDLREASCVFALLLMGPVAFGQDPATVKLKEQIKGQLFEAAVARLTGQSNDPPALGTEEIQIRFIDPEGEGTKGGWGLYYDWKAGKDTARAPSMDDLRNGAPFVLNRMSYEVALKGTHAFSEATNNEDLSTALAVLHLERVDKGQVRIGDRQVNLAFMKCLDVLPEVNESTPPEELRRQNELHRECISNSNVDALIEDEPTSYVYMLDFRGGVEANQDYTNTRGLYGLKFVLASEPSQSASRFNAFDLPFRGFRKAFSSKSNYVAPFPAISLSLDRLDAKDDEIRAALTSKSTFTRASAEVAFQTILASFDEGPLRFNISYRYFHEFSPPEAIEAADLDAFDYTKMQLRFPARLLPLVETDEYELFVSYTDGKLPFDITSGKAIEVGISTSIDMLARLLAK